MAQTSTELNATARPRAGKGAARQARREGKVPAVIYGDGKPPENLLRPTSLSAEEDSERNELRELANRRYAARRRKEFTEANSYVYDMAGQFCPADQTGGDHCWIASFSLAPIRGESGPGSTGSSSS